jgi:hypothetical protein
VKTRTLLLLAVGCGLAILVAGSIALLRTAGQKNSTTLVAIGATGRAGDATVAVDAVDVQPDVVTVTVTLGGVDDADGLDGFTMVAAQSTREVEGGTCAGFTTTATQCTLTFANTDLDGSTRVLLFDRADDRLRWTLVA